MASVKLILVMHSGLIALPLLPGWRLSQRAIHQFTMRGGRWLSLADVVSQIRIYVRGNHADVASTLGSLQA